MSEPQQPRSHQSRQKFQQTAEDDSPQRPPRDVAAATGEAEAAPDPEEEEEALFAGWKCALKR